MSRLQANLLLLLTAAIWGTSFVVQKFGMTHVGALAFSGARFLLGAAVVLPFALPGFRGLALRPGDWLGMIATGLVLCAGAVLQQTGISMTSVTNAGFLTGLYVPLVPLLALMGGRKAAHPVIWPAALGSVFGTWLLSGGGAVDVSTGDFWVIASAFFWALHVLLVGRMAGCTNAPLVLALVQFAVAGIVAAVLAFIVEPAPLAGLAAAWPEACYVGVFSVGIGFTLQSVAQRHTAPSAAAVILSGEVVFAAISGAIVFGDRLSLQQSLGCLAILASMLAVQMAPARRQKSGGVAKRPPV